MVRGLVEPATEALLVISGAVAIYVLAATAHERSHWLVGRLWSNQVTVIHIFGAFPVSVDFRDPYDVPPSVIRIAGIAPCLFCLPLGVGIYTTLEASFQHRLAVALPFLAASLLSPSDLLAFCYPRRFQKLAAEHEQMTHLGVLDVLIEELQS